MTRRSVHDIIEDWRAAERELPADGSEPDPDLLARIDALRVEHDSAMAMEMADDESSGNLQVEGI
jgi:hypothetical protein